MYPPSVDRMMTEVISNARILDLRRLFSPALTGCPLSSDASSSWRLTRHLHTEAHCKRLAEHMHYGLVQNKCTRNESSMRVVLSRLLLTRFDNMSLVEGFSYDALTEMISSSKLLSEFREKSV